MFGHHIVFVFQFLFRGEPRNLTRLEQPLEHLHPQLFRQPLPPDFVVAPVELRHVGVQQTDKKIRSTYLQFVFPDFFIDDRVMVTIIGKILDMDYANILARNTDLPLIDIELLNRLQLKKALTAPEIRRLRSKKLIEGKKPNLIIAKDIAQKTGQSVVYSKHKGLKDRACEELLLESLRDHEVLSRDEITELLWDALPDMLNDAQKNNKIRNILFRMKKQEKIINTTKGNISTWRIKTKN